MLSSRSFETPYGPRCRDGHDSNNQLSKPSLGARKTPKEKITPSPRRQMEHTCHRFFDHTNLDEEVAPVSAFSANSMQGAGLWTIPFYPAANHYRGYPEDFCVLLIVDPFPITQRDGCVLATRGMVSGPQ